VRLKGRLRQGGKRLPLQIQGVGRRLDCWYEERVGTDPAAAAPPAGSASEGEGPDLLELVVLATAGAAGPLRDVLDRL
jgi:cobalamin biosynthesis protein CobW